MKANPSIISSYIFKFASALHCKRFINKHDYLKLPTLEEGVYFPYFSYPEGWSEIVPENKGRKYVDYLLGTDTIKTDGTYKTYKDLCSFYNEFDLPYTSGGAPTEKLDQLLYYNLAGGWYGNVTPIMKEILDFSELNSPPVLNIRLALPDCRFEDNKLSLSESYNWEIKNGCLVCYPK
jgi:hypothetical protein